MAVVWGKATGFEGLMTITEGQRVTEDRAAFATLREGFLFDGHHAGYQVQLNRFAVTYQVNGQPRDFVSNVTVYRDGRPLETRDIRVNEFLGHDDVDFYQQDYGWAPRLRVTNPAGQVVFDSPVQFFGENKSAEVGVLKVPGLGFTLPGASAPAQLGARMVVFPDARTMARVNADGSVDAGATEYGPGGMEARNPVLQVQLFVGDLGLGSGRPQSVNSLDTSRMSPYFQGGRPVPLALGQSLQLPLVGADCSRPAASGCFKLEFVRLPQYSLFHVKRDDGVPFVYASFALVMAGLLSKLYLRPLLEARARRRRRREAGDRAYPDDAWLASTAAAGDEAAEEPATAGSAAAAGSRASPSSGGR